MLCSRLQELSGHSGSLSEYFLQNLPFFKEHHILTFIAYELKEEDLSKEARQKADEVLNESRASFILYKKTLLLVVDQTE